MSDIILFSLIVYFSFGLYCCGDFVSTVRSIKNLELKDDRERREFFEEYKQIKWFIYPFILILWPLYLGVIRD